MSKITPKNLCYDSTLPPFLARLQAANSATEGRHEFNMARPKKQRTEGDIEEDEPVYVDEESGETLTKKQLEAAQMLDRQVRQDGNEQQEMELKQEGERATERELVAAIGASRKRKAGRIVGDEEDTRARGLPQTDDRIARTEARKVGKGKSKMKERKIGLSFGDEE